MRRPSAVLCILYNVDLYDLFNISYINPQILAIFAIHPFLVHSALYIHYFLCVFLISFYQNVSDIYHIKVTIVNWYNSSVRVFTNDTSRPFVIPANGRHQINLAFPKKRAILITAKNETTDEQLTLNSKIEVIVISSINKIHHFYFIPSSGES